MVTIKTEQEIETLREGGKILAQILQTLAEKTKAGVMSDVLETTLREEIKKYGAKPAFMGYTPHGASRPFPAALCLSINSQIVHGIPHEHPVQIKEGDIVSLDTGIIFHGLYTDSAITVGVGEIDGKAKLLLKATKESLDAGINAVRPGVKTGDVGMAIEAVARKYKFKIADELGGHGVGYKPHEDPFMPNFGKKGEGVTLKEGMVLAIEPMLNEGTSRIVLEDDGYTISTGDGKRSAHFEHTVVVTKDGCEILTQL